MSITREVACVKGSNTDNGYTLFWNRKRVLEQCASPQKQSQSILSREQTALQKLKGLLDLFSSKTGRYDYSVEGSESPLDCESSRSSIYCDSEDAECMVGQPGRDSGWRGFGRNSRGRARRLVVWKYRGSAPTRASQQGRSRGSRVTWSKLGTLVHNPLYFHGNQVCYHGNMHRYHGKHGLNGNHRWSQYGATPPPRGGGSSL